MFYKNPAIEYAKAECLYHLGRYGGNPLSFESFSDKYVIEMMSSLFYVASYVNQEGMGNRSRASIYSSYWNNKGNDYLKSVTERSTITQPLASNFASHC